MKKSDLVSVSVFVKDALDFFKDVSYLDLSSLERFVLLHLIDADNYLTSLTFISHD